MLIETVQNSPKNLKVGSSGDAVIALQKVLKMKKYYIGEVNGRFNKELKKAVMKFQTDYHIDIDGIVGPKTKSYLLKFEM